MRLEILPYKPEHQNKYVITIEFMSGDADAEDFEKFIFNDEPSAIDFVKKLNSFKKYYRPNGSEQDSKDGPYLFENWPGDSTCDYQIRAAYVGFTIEYFDQNGWNYKVKVRK